jgi:pilus assembly protein CpaE
MKTQAVVVADDPVYVNWLQNTAEGVDFAQVRPVDAEDLIERVQMMGRADIVFFQFEPDNFSARATLVERFVERMPNVPVAGLGSDSSPDVVLAAMRAGARDFFVLRRDESNVAALLGRLLRRSAQVSPAAAARQTQGKLFSVMSAHPGPGIAFTAEHLALALQEKLPKNERVLLLDVAGPAGAAAIYLNIVQTYSLLDAINDVYRCDQTLVETAFSKHASGIFVLSLPEDLIGPPRINVEEFLKLLKILRGLFGCIVVAFDGGLEMTGMTSVIEQADRSLLVSDQSIIESRHNKYLLRQLRLEDCALERTNLVVDNYRRRMGLEPQNLAEILDLKLLAALSGEGVARVQAMNAGEPMMVIAPKDPYCETMRRMAAALLSGDPQVEAVTPGLMARLFS